MLDERLAGANRQAQKRWIKAAVAVLIGLSGFGLWFMEMFMEREPPAVPPSAIQDFGARAEADQPVQPINADPREGFKQTLGEYVREAEPVVRSPEFANWDAPAQRDLVAMKAAAVQTFGEGRHADALFQIEALLEKARGTLRRREAAFTTALSAADASLGQDNYADALLHIREALRIKPESPEALRLQAEIERLPQVLAHLKAAQVARLENNTQAELRALQQLVTLDPSRSAARSRLASLRGAVQDDRYRAQIARGLAALEKNDLDTAHSHLAQARQLFPNRTETALLAKQVDDLDRARQVEGLLQNASAAAQADDWQTAARAYQRVEALRPGHALALQGRQTADRILSLLSAVRAHLGAPHRLSSPNIAAQAQELIEQSREAGRNSPELAVRASELQQALARYSRQVPVRIVSDGKTNIAVRGVGRVGAVLSKLIHLKPGAYKFEGRRSGYKSVIVTRLIGLEEAQDGGRGSANPAIHNPAHNPEIPVVEIVCDEPI